MKDLMAHLNQVLLMENFALKALNVVMKIVEEDFVEAELMEVIVLYPINVITWIVEEDFVEAYLMDGIAV